MNHYHYIRKKRPAQTAEKILCVGLAAAAITVCSIPARSIEAPAASGRTVAVDLPLIQGVQVIPGIRRAGAGIDREAVVAMMSAKMARAEAYVREMAEPEPAYTERELELLACTIYCEAGSDSISDATRRMVGEVVLNRVADERYPDTIEEVLTQKSQYGRFHWTGVVWPARASKDVEAHAVERAYACARTVFEGERLLPTDVIYQDSRPQGRETVVKVPGFYFCR